MATAQGRRQAASDGATDQRPSCDLGDRGGRHSEGGGRAYRAAIARWPRARITLRQGARVIEDSRRLRVV